MLASVNLFCVLIICSEGSDNMKKPCQYLLIKRRGSAASKPVSILPADESRKTPEDAVVCGCCSCNEDLIKLQVKRHYIEKFTTHVAW